ncbi:MAG: hypothetical protein ABSF51_11465 [Verrucomicrobiota bacterium]
MIITLGNVNDLGKPGEKRLNKRCRRFQPDSGEGTETHGNGTMKTLKASVWPPLQLASELHQVLSVMAVRAPIMADLKEKK